MEYTGSSPGLGLSPMLWKGNMPQVFIRHSAPIRHKDRAWQSSTDVKVAGMSTLVKSFRYTHKSF